MKIEKRFVCTIDEEDGDLVTLKMSPVNLGALLELADEMEAWALTCDHYDRRVAPIEVSRYARRIREALGV